MADNVVFAQISDYLQYVQQRQRDGVVTTHTVVCSVEYSSTEQDTDQEYSFRDGVGEFCAFSLLGESHLSQSRI